MMTQKEFDKIHFCLFTQYRFWQWLPERPFVIKSKVYIKLTSLLLEPDKYQYIDITHCLNPLTVENYMEHQMQKPTDLNVTETVDVSIETPSDKINNRIKITHHPEIEKLIKMYRELIKENDNEIGFKFVVVQTILPSVYDEEKEEYTVTVQYSPVARYWQPAAFRIELMQKQEDKWEPVAEMHSSLEVFAELTYPGATEGFMIAIDNNPDYTWLQLTDRGYKFFTEDSYSYDVKQFDEWFKSLNEEDSCKNILVTQRWKEHVFKRVMRLQPEDPILQRELSAAPDEHAENMNLSFNEIVACMLSCMKSDAELIKTKNYFFAKDSDIVRIFTYLCIQFMNQLRTLVDTDKEQMYQVVRTYYIDKILNAE